MYVTTTSSTFLSRRVLFILCLVIFLCSSLKWLSWESSSHNHDGNSAFSGEHVRPYPPSLPKPAPSEVPGNGTSLQETNLSQDCRSIEGADDVFIAMKIGSNEIHQKLPQHILTLFKCVPDYAIFSDLEQTIAGQFVFDSIADINDAVKDSHEEFQYYRNVQELHRGGQSIADRLQENKKGDDRMGWKLDKWKFLPMVQKAYELHPTKKWYLFVEGDTGIIWTNLLQWLQRLDPDKDIYSGSQNAQNDINFAHGGSGVLISRSAMQKLVGGVESHLDKWQTDTANSCCGDVELARHFKDTGVEVTGAFPLLQGEAPMTVDWNARHMCVPSVSWHHVSPVDIHMLWELQTNWTETHGWQKPYLFRDLFADYVDRYIRVRRDGWDNISAEKKYVQPIASEVDEDWNKLTEVEKNSAESFEACRAACYANTKCLQFRYLTGECNLGENIRIGKAKMNEKVSSGWLLERIRTFEDSFFDCDPNWSFNQ